ncbi:MAG TPA: fused MFS/spermidine synthase, partial [Myxococcota bacterium]
RARSAVAIGFFFVSGAAGLVYEVCWIRRAALVFGSTTYALSSVLAIFFLGLACGSYLFGYLSERVSRPLRIYGLAEVAVAALALASLPLFDWADGVFGRAYRAFGSDSPLLWAVRLALVSVVLLPPSVLMGGTLPLFCRQFVRSRARIAESVGFLYGVNTAGAAAGCVAAGFLLVPTLGLRWSVGLAALLSAVSGIAVGSMPLVADPVGASVARDEPRSRLRARLIVSGLFFATGFVALGNQVLWTRYLSLLLRSTVTTYTTTLSVVLVGIVLGSVIASRFFDKPVPRARIFGAFQVAVGLTVLCVLLLPPGVWARLGGLHVAAFLLLLPAATLSGASFPLAVRMVVEDPTLAGLGVGRLTAINTLGGIAGSLALGFFALPHLGLYASALLTTGLSLAAGFSAWLLLEPRAPLRWRVAAVAACLSAWLAAPSLLGTRIPDDFLAEPQLLVDHREGLESNLSVVRNGGTLHLVIDQWWQGQQAKSHQIMAAHVPALLHPAPRRVLVVGVGTGQTASRFLMHDVERLDCVDIEPEIFDLIEGHFESAWLHDDRVRLLREDGRSFLSHGVERYDLISLELGQTMRPGIASFYTQEFYERARTRLEPGGVISQFLPIPFLDPETFRSAVRTFLASFPEAVLWYNKSELLLIGRNGGRLQTSVERLAERIAREPIRSDLRFSYWGGEDFWLARPRTLLGGFLIGPVSLAALSEGAVPLRDDLPRLDYAAGDSLRSDAGREEKIVALIRRHLDPLRVFLSEEPPEALVAAAERVRQGNLREVEADALLRRLEAERAEFDPERAVAYLEDVLRLHPENPKGQRMLGDALLAQERPAEAEIHFARAVEMRPDDVTAQRGLARALQLQGRTDAAIPHYLDALERDPADAESHWYVGVALWQTGAYPEALHHLETAARLRPDWRALQQQLNEARRRQQERQRRG